jgi:WXG100 family type VII secretion target
MPTLHMDTETARSATALMQSSYNQLLEIIVRINTSINKLQPVWTGNSATEYFAQIDQWTTKARQLTEELTNLTVRLDNEVGEWEQMSRKL